MRSSCLLIFLAALSLPIVGFAQESQPTGTSIEELGDEIRAKARGDVGRGKAPESAAGLDLLYGADAGRLGQDLRWVARVYETAYDATKSAPKPWWMKLEPGTGWIVAAISLLLLIFKDLLKDFLVRCFKALRDGIYERLAGHPVFRRAALGRYRRALIRRYHELKIPFRPDRPLAMREIFVPLKVSGGSDLEQSDAYQAMAEHHRMMVTGPPGSGKSMLLRNIALSFAEGRRLPGAGYRIPVLLELSRLNESNAPVEEHLVEILRLNNFPHAENFVRLALEQGVLLLLFDGLDEVNSAQREVVVRRIKDVLEQHQKCPMVLSCRTAVYRQEFADVVDRTLEIVEFSDQQIRSFLSSWEEDMPAEKSILQLLSTLGDRPRIMALARNPLLLTIIAYLYTDTEFVLPHSRAEFYDQSADVLLDQWKRERNRFKAIHKRLVLQHLALFNQDRGTERGQDRRSLDLKTTLEQVRGVLPELNLEEKQAGALIDEIVDRSGLLLAIDGGERYQFAHLTLQEFFAAGELKSDPGGLVQRFADDPTAWRETVKLWCGLGSDSTELVRSIYEKDPITAFECLADAQKISPELSDEILASFKGRLAQEGDTGEAIRRALAAVAADARPRGRAVFDFLVEELSAEESDRQMAAARALSLTNLPRAAEVLAARVPNQESLSPSLVRMGNLAVPFLDQPAEPDVDLKRIEILAQIGTPEAAQALVPLLWGQEDVAIEAAWALAGLLSDEAVENALRSCELSEESRKAPYLDWIWEPFEAPGDSALPIITGRVAYLIDENLPCTAAGSMPPPDPRLILPLCATKAESSAALSKLWEWEEDPTPAVSDFWHSTLGKIEGNDPEQRKESLWRWLDEYAGQLPEAAKKAPPLNIQFVAVVSKEKGWVDLFCMLPESIQWPLVSQFIRGPWPNIDDWKNLFRPLDFDFLKSRHRWISFFFAAALTLIALLQLGRMIFSEDKFLSLHNGLLAAIALVAMVDIMLIFIFLSNPDRGRVLTFLFVGIFFLFLYFFIKPMKTIKNLYSLLSEAKASREVVLSGILPSLIGLAWAPIVICFGTLALLSYFSLATIVIFWALSLGSGLLTDLLGMRRHRAAQNPLRGIIAARGLRRTIGDPSWPPHPAHHSMVASVYDVAYSNRDACIF